MPFEIFSWYFKICRKGHNNLSHTKMTTLAFYTPPHFSGGVLWYTFRCPSICLSVCLSIHLSAPFSIDNLGICSRKFFKFCIYIIIRDEWYGIVYGQNPSFYNRVTALVHTGKIVSGVLLFTIYDISMKLHSYVIIKGYILRRRTITQIVPFHELLALDRSEKCFLTCSSITIWNFWMKLHKYI